jgi:hypothetical protein
MLSGLPGRQIAGEGDGYIVIHEIPVIKRLYAAGVLLAAAGFSPSIAGRGQLIPVLNELSVTTVR